MEAAGIMLPNVNHHQADRRDYLSPSVNGDVLGLVFAPHEHTDMPD